MPTGKTANPARDRTDWSRLRAMSEEEVEQDRGRGRGQPRHGQDPH